MGISWQNFRLHRAADRFGPKQLLVVDLDRDASRFTVMERSGRSVSWQTAMSLPRITENYRIGDDSLANFLNNEKQLQAPYVSVILNTPGGFVRLLNFTGQPGRSEAVAREVRQTLGVGDEYDVQYRVVNRAQPSDGQNAEYSVLAAAMLKTEIEELRKIVVDAGMKPVSLMPHGVVVANLAEASIDLVTNEKAVGFLHVGGESSMLVLYVRESLALARQFKTGFNVLLDNVKKDYGLDDETAAKFLASGSFDFSGNLSAPAKTWMHQIGISLDFIERRYGQRVDDLFVLGRSDVAASLRAAIGSAVGREVKAWEAVDKFAADHRPELEAGNEQDFAVAVCEGQRVMQEGFDAHA